jgi:uncharacterized membrane protein YGL010W
LAFAASQGIVRVMKAYFRTQMTDYVQYHRDWWNGMMHVFGIIFLFLAAVLPLSLWPVTVLGIHTSVAVFAVVPVLAYWLLLDAGLGLGIIASAAVLLFVAAAIVGIATVATVWSISIVLIVIGFALQVVGHQVFERRQPALMDNPTHLLLGPMFVMAKLYIMLGFRKDLAAVIYEPSTQAPPIPPLAAERGQS